MFAIFGLGVAYGIISLCALACFTILVVLTYDEHVEPLLDDERDRLDALIIISQELGVFRYALMCIMALLWPIPFVFVAVFHLWFKDKSFSDIPVTAQRIMLWVYLGFGKFTPTLDESQGR